MSSNNFISEIAIIIKLIPVLMYESKVLSFANAVLSAAKKPSISFHFYRNYKLYLHFYHLFYSLIPQFLK